MTALIYAWLVCNGTENLGALCEANTFSDIYVNGASPRNAGEALTDPRARGWHKTRDGRHLCPDCWGEGQR